MLFESASSSAQADERSTSQPRIVLLDYLNRGENVTRKTRNIYNDQTFVSELPHLHKQQPGHCTSSIEVTSQTANAFKPSVDRCSGHIGPSGERTRTCHASSRDFQYLKGNIETGKAEESLVHVGDNTRLSFWGKDYCIEI